MATTLEITAADYKVADLTLADWGRKEITIAEQEMPASAMAAAAWSWVEKMLHDAQRTWAPR